MTLAVNRCPWYRHEITAIENDARGLPPQVPATPRLTGESVQEASRLLARTSLPILAAAERAGLDCKLILERAGITAAQLEIPQAFATTEQVSRVWELAVEMSGDPWFSLRSAVGAPSLNAVDYLLSSSQSLLHAVETVNAYFRSNQANLEFSLETQPNAVAIRWNVVGFAVFPSRPGLEYGLGRIVSMLKMGIGPSFRPLAMHFTWPAPADPAPMVELLQCPLHFEQQKAGVLVSHRDASQQFYGTNAALAKAFAHEASLTLTSLGADHAVLERVRRLLKEGLALNMLLTVDDAARKMGMSRRTLQRQLGSQNRSFSSLVDDARKQVALTLIEQGEGSAERISNAICFAGVTTFYKAYRRWTGQPFALSRPPRSPS